MTGLSQALVRSLTHLFNHTELLRSWAGRFQLCLYDFPSEALMIISSSFLTLCPVCVFPELSLTFYWLSNTFIVCGFFLLKRWIWCVFCVITSELLVVLFSKVSFLLWSREAVDEKPSMNCDSESPWTTFWGYLQFRTARSKLDINISFSFFVFFLTLIGLKTFLTSCKLRKLNWTFPLQGWIHTSLFPLIGRFIWQVWEPNWILWCGPIETQPRVCLQKNCTVKQ